MLQSMRTTMLMLQDRRNETVGWRNYMPWEVGEEARHDFRAEMTARADRVNRVEERVAELRDSERKLRSTLAERQGEMLQPFEWEPQSVTSNDMAAPGAST